MEDPTEMLTRKHHNEHLTCLKAKCNAANRNFGWSFTRIVSIWENSRVCTETFQELCLSLKGGQLMERKTQLSIWYFLLAFLAIILFQRYFVAGHVQDVSYGEFRRLVQEGKVNDLVISSEVIRGKLR
jgi:hypothetical protein